MESSSLSIGLKEMALEERPREKMLTKGEKSLSNAELLAIILRTGTKKQSVLELANYIINKDSQGIRWLKDITIQELCEIDGIGLSKAAQIKATLELGIRIASAKPNKYKVTNPWDIYKYYMDSLRYLNKEIFKIIYSISKINRLELSDEKEASAAYLRKVLVGLSEDVIIKAKDFMSEENLQFEDLIRDLQEKSIIANRDAREAKRIKDEAENLKKKYDEKLKKLDTVRDKVYDEARQEAKQIVSNAKDEADEIIKAMRELEKMGIGEGGRSRLEEERRKLKTSLEEKEAAMIKSRENTGESITKVTLGMEAFLPSLNQRVVIVSMPDNKGEVQVEAGIMKINVKLKDLRKVPQEPKKKEKKKREVKLNMKSVDSRIDLRGMDSEEACYRTDKYLDEAYLGNLGEVTIVHGKGTGILRKAINDMLKRHPHVKSYRLGVYGEGGDGVTVVTLK